MNLRKQNGFSGIDISITVLIILILIPTTFGMVYNLGKYKSKLSRLSTSVNLAVEIIEEAKAISFNSIDMDEIEDYMKAKYDDDKETDTVTGTIFKDDVAYKVDITYENPSQYEKENSNTHIVKKINVKVTYPIGKDTREIEISRVLKRKI